MKSKNTQKPQREKTTNETKKMFWKTPELIILDSKHGTANGPGPTPPSDGSSYS